MRIWSWLYTPGSVFGVVPFGFGVETVISTTPPSTPPAVAAFSQGHLACALQTPGASAASTATTIQQTLFTRTLAFQS